MIRALLTLLKIGIFVAAVVWLAEHPGTIAIDWLDYKVTFHVGFFFAAMLVLIAIGITLFSIIKTALDMPKNMTRYRDMTYKDKGARAIALGLTAVAAGDAKNANYQAERAKRFLNEDDPLPQLLQAQAARLKGNEVDAARAFMKLMDHKETSFLGIRGLLQSALDHGDYAGAVELGHKALEEYPKQGWILCIVYDLEIKARNWDSARKVLYRAEKAGVIATNKANADRVAMYIAQAEDNKARGEEEFYFRNLNKAYKTDQNFVPGVMRLARMYLERNKRKAALSIIEKAWKNNPHRGLVELWMEAYKPERENDTMERVRWIEKLVKYQPDSVEALLALASVQIQDGLWGEARKSLEKAESIRPNVSLYKLWAKLEERATHNEAKVREWLEKAADAPRERVWICSETGRIYDEWTPISDQGLFNTIIWDFPQGRNVTSMALMNHGGLKPALLQAS